MPVHRPDAGKGGAGEGIKSMKKEEGRTKSVPIKKGTKNSPFFIPHSSLREAPRGVYRNRSGDLCNANAALWPSELIPRKAKVQKF
jgi:hypothetical protein